MTCRRKRRKKTTRTNNTGHRRALQMLEVIAKIVHLRKRWRYLDRVERGDRLRELIALGCSMRGLAAELRRGLTTIRRHIDLADSPERVREAARNGYSAKLLLAHKTQARQIHRRDLKLEEERVFGRHSDSAASFMLEFCRELGEVGSVDVPALKLSIALALRLASRNAVPKFSLRLPMKKILQITRPENVPDEFPLEHTARWLAGIIARFWPERTICENALEKFMKRAKEIDPPQPEKTPLEAWKETVIRRASFEEDLKRERAKRRWY